MLFADAQQSIDTDWKYYALFLRLLQNLNGHQFGPLHTGRVLNYGDKNKKSEKYMKFLCHIVFFT